MANRFKPKCVANIVDFTILVKCRAVQKHDKEEVEPQFFSPPAIPQGLKPSYIFSHLRHD
jgi:hypothetical protein